MRVSLNQIRKFIDFELPPVDELVSRINQQLGGVEEVIDLAGKYSGAVIVRVVECDKHPDADRLSVTKIDDGGIIQDVARDDNGYVQVVCGAPNVHADMFAVWLPPASTVPASIDEGEPFVLEARKLRGVLSQGMLAAADELAIGSDHEGIIEITAADLQYETDLRPGMNFAKTFGLDDMVIDIENKMFTHRPDLFGQLGVAREISAILKGVTSKEEGIIDTNFINPDWYSDFPEFALADTLQLAVFNEAEEKAPRFMAVVLGDVTVEPSPLWLQCALVAMGSKPINNIVDITNYVMLMSAQPTHAYDYDKLAGETLGVRMAHEGETAELLNGKTYQLSKEDIVIADSEKVVGLGGIMGGADSEVTDKTTRIVLECANFDMYTLRKTSMRHGLFTDALTRFNKGQSYLQNSYVMAYMIGLIESLTVATQDSNVYDKVASSYDSGAVSLNGGVAASTSFINERLGLAMTSDQIENLLRRVNITADQNHEGSKVYTAPFWRTDIELPEDIVEEVGRLYGFDKLPRELPQRSIAPTPKNMMRDTKRHIRETLAKFGANEVVSYSFIHGQTIDKAEQSLEDAYRIKNALSPDLQYYRLNVLSSLLERIHPNIKAGYDEFVLFEIGKYHNKNQIGVSETGIPDEKSSVDIVYTAKNPKDGAAYYHAKRIVEDLLTSFGFSADFCIPVHDKDDARIDSFEPRRLATVKNRTTGEELGYVGELKRSVQKAFKLPEYTAAASLDIEKLVEQYRHDARVNYQPLSKYPSVERDITIKVASDVTFARVAKTLQKTEIDKNIRLVVSPMGIYQPEESGAKNVTLHVQLTPLTQTLSSDEASSIMERLAAIAQTELDATII